MCWGVCVCAAVWGRKTQSSDKDILQATPPPHIPIHRNHKSEETGIHDEHKQDYKNSDPKQQHTHPNTRK